MTTSVSISIHAPPRGATAIIVEPCQRRIFQFTPLREGRLAVGEVAACQRANFNSRPSARGDPCPAAVQPDGIISIHAPPRGATGFVLRAARRLAISIHAPPRGATQQVAHVQHNAQFQFTPLREGRPTGRESPFRRSHFNSRPSARGDQRRRRQWKPLRQFQFTPLREGRPAACASASTAGDDFNSRPSARGDCAVDGDWYDAWISIHAPPRGATMQLCDTWTESEFQFTPLREGRLYLQKISKKM